MISNLLYYRELCDDSRLTLTLYNNYNFYTMLCRSVLSQLTPLICYYCYILINIIKSILKCWKYIFEFGGEVMGELLNNLLPKLPKKCL